jgi:hypothetical protein
VIEERAQAAERPLGTLGPVGGDWSRMASSSSLEANAPPMSTSGSDR